MSQTQKIIVEPETRGGATTSVVLSNSLPAAPSVSTKQVSFAEKVFESLKDDQNLIYLATRLQNYIETTESRMECLRQAIEAGDGMLVCDIAKDLSDSTARLGAVSLMRHFISLQMLGRRGLLLQARKLMADIETQFDVFRNNLISTVG
jgi:hypothetical protein